MYCNKCGSVIPADCEFCIKCGAHKAAPIKDAGDDASEPVKQIHCNKCGSVIPDGCEFCVNCGAPTAAPVPAPTAYQQPVHQAQMAYAKAPVSEQRRDFYGNFGGLIISGGLILLLLIVGSIVNSPFVSVRNFSNLFRQVFVLLPIAFAAALTVRTKGLDLSVPAMIALGSAIILRLNSFATAVVIALAVCVLIGVINAVCISFLKLPGILVTLAMFIIISFAASRIGSGAAFMPIQIAPVWMTAAVLIAAGVAVALALLTSTRKGQEGRFVSSVLPVYAGSGIFAALYLIAVFVRSGAIAYYPPQITFIVFVGLLLSITQFHKNKALAVVFALLPALLFGMITNILNIAGINYYVQSIIFIVLIVVLAVLVFCRGRAALVGQRLYDGSNKRVWIALAPLLVYLVVDFILIVISITYKGRQSILFAQLTGTVPQIVLLLITIGFAVWFVLGKPRSAQYER